MEDEEIYTPGPSEWVSPDDPLINGTRWRRERDEARAALARKDTELEKLRDALRFYAEEAFAPGVYSEVAGMSFRAWEGDEGSLARAALASTPES